MAALPSGTVTFLFTDIEGSTTRWEHHPEAMRAALARHDVLLRAAIHDHHGHVVKTMGDAFHAAFVRAPDAVAAVLDAQRRLHDEPWGEIGPLRVRMALHTGTAEERDGDYYGPPLNRAARLMSTGHGGQILLSEVTSRLVRDTLPEGVGLMDLGNHRLKDLTEPEHIFQLVAHDLVSDFPPLASLDARSNNLPVHPTPLLGRDREVTEINTLLRANVRLVTLTGPGGTGKTRLSLQVAADLLEDCEHGVFLVELAPIRDPTRVPDVIAQVLGVQDAGGRPVLDGVKEYVRRRSLLLVLDNFEQIVAAAPVVGDLLAASPGLKVLVTSREPLRLRGEHEYAVPPLGVPAAHEVVGPETLTRYGALALFLERAIEIRADFAATPENAEAIRDICARLDGLPLAIELAAARVRLLTPEVMARRLERRLPLLTGGARDLPTRQQTLRGAIDWSHDLLDEPERRLFRRLGVFVGGWVFEAAEAVSGDDLGVDVLDGLESLVAKSLVKQGTDLTGEPRFWMLETIREYAAEQLKASGEAAATRQRHAHHFLELAEEAAPRLSGSEQVAWLDRLTTEHDNARSAITWMQGVGGDLDGALRLVTALYQFWNMRNHRGDFERIDTVLEASRGQVSLARANALRLAADRHRMGDDRARPVACGEEAVEMFRALGDRAGLARTLVHLGLLLRDRRELLRARAVTEEGLEIARDLGDRVTTGVAQYHLASILWYEQFADRPIERLLAPPGGGTPQGVQAEVAQVDNARLIEDGAASAAKARALLKEAITTFRDLGNVWHIGMMLVGGGALAQWAWATGDYAAAVAANREGIQMYVKAGDVRSVGDALANLARVALSLGDADRAARLFGAADAMYEATGTTRMRWNWPTAEEECAAVQARLSAENFAAAWAEGQAKTLNEAVAYALETTGPV